MSAIDTFLIRGALDPVRNALVARGLVPARSPADVALRWDWLADRTACATSAAALRRGAEALRRGVRLSETTTKGPGETAYPPTPTATRTRTCNV